MNSSVAAKPDRNLLFTRPRLWNAARGKARTRFGVRGRQHALSATVGLLLSGLLPVGSQAAVANGDFEIGSLTGWTVAGSGSAQTLSIGVMPPAGVYQGYIETTGNYTALAPAVATSLGVSGGTIAGLGAGSPVNGTGISQLITVPAGAVLSYDWNFISDELNEPATFNDFAFFTVSGSAYLLASRNASTFDLVSPPPGFDGQTDWSTSSYTFPVAGTYTIGFGVYNVGDAGHNSALLLDSVAVSVPEPGLATLLPLLSLALLRRQRP